MERLTARFDGWVMRKGCHGPCRTCNGAECSDIYLMIDRLAAYEDTGLEPGEIMELAQAEKDGRLVVLPCKVGDTVWMIVNKRPKIHMPEFSFVKKSRLTWNNMHRILEAFGKTVFLTRDEAEAALERRKGEQNETD